MGSLHNRDRQLSLSDTPGIHKPKTALRFRGGICYSTIEIGNSPLYEFTGSDEKRGKGDDIYDYGSRLKAALKSCYYKSSIRLTRSIRPTRNRWWFRRWTKEVVEPPGNNVAPDEIHSQDNLEERFSVFPLNQITDSSRTVSKFLRWFRKKSSSWQSRKFPFRGGGGRVHETGWETDKVHIQATVAQSRHDSQRALSLANKEPYSRKSTR